MNQFTVLYAEDEESDIFLLQHAFKKAGIKNDLVAVRDGKAAMDYLAGNGDYADRKAHPLPGLLLLDLNLPYWSGLEILAWMRQQPSLRCLPVVILSSSCRPDDVVRSYETGANGYLVKPTTMDELSALAAAVRDFWLVCNRLPESLAAQASDAARLRA